MDFKLLEPFTNKLIKLPTKVNILEEEIQMQYLTIE